MSKTVVCGSCDLVVNVDSSKGKFENICPRCGRRLNDRNPADRTDIAIISFSAIQFLFISIFVPFMSISAMGINSGMSLYSIIYILGHQWGLLLYSFLFFTFFSPVLVLVSSMLICGFRIKPGILWSKIYQFCHGMCMVDVFVLGICVSLIKLTSLVDVDFYLGFYTTFIFSVLLLWCCIKFKPSMLWNLVKEQEEIKLKLGKTAITQNVKKCTECGYYFHSEAQTDICPRCHSKVEFRKNACFSKCLSLLIAAVILYLPSNLYPVMYTEFLGSTTGSNIIEGVIAMWEMKSYFVSIVILLASIFIPAFKIFSIAFILYVTKFSKIRIKKRVSRLFRFVMFIGRWSLIDVYVVIIMSSVVRITGFLSIYPGFAIICFCAVVLITVFSADEFDERLIWDSEII